MINKLTLIGAGLIGGSLSLSLKQAGYVGEVVAYDTDQDNAQTALNLGVADQVTDDLQSAIVGADMVVIAVPVGAVAGVANALVDLLTPEMVLTDVGSVKGGVVAAIESAFGELPSNFVPAHPIAGTEKSGASAAFDSLFNGKRVMLTPAETTSRQALESVRKMWQAAGGRVETLTTEQHDAIFAATSHLPHLLAYSVVNALTSIDMSEEIFTYAAGGLHDFTRIASSNPVMWRDVCLHNREQLLSVIDVFEKDLDQIREAIDRGDGDYLFERFTQAKITRDTHQPVKK